MTKSGSILEPLTKEEAAWLMNIFTLRHKNLFWAGCIRCFFYSIVIATGFICFWSFASLMVSGEASFMFSSLKACFLFTLTIALSLTAIACYFVNRYMVIPYKKDAECGQKLRIAQKILSKEYYPVTGQYFFRLENNYEKLYEVDEQTYNSHNENDVLYMYQGIHSKHIFGDNDQVTYKFFTMRRLGSRSNY